MSNDDQLSIVVYCKILTHNAARFSIVSILILNSFKLFNRQKTFVEYMIWTCSGLLQ